MANLKHMRVVKWLIILFFTIGVVLIYLNLDKPQSPVEIKPPASPINSSGNTIDRPAAIGPLNQNDLKQDSSLLGDVKLKDDSSLPSVGPIKAGMLDGTIIDPPVLESSAALPVVMVLTDALTANTRAFQMKGKKRTLVQIPGRKWVILLLTDPRAALDAEAVLLSTGVLADNVKVINNVILMTDNNYQALTTLDQEKFEAKMLEIEALV